jgi:hypothetical protein
MPSLQKVLNRRLLHRIFRARIKKVDVLRIDSNDEGQDRPRLDQRPRKRRRRRKKRGADSILVCFALHCNRHEIARRQSLSKIFQARARLRENLRKRKGRCPRRRGEFFHVEDVRFANLRIRRRERGLDLIPEVGVGEFLERGLAFRGGGEGDEKLISCGEGRARWGWRRKMG